MATLAELQQELADFKNAYSLLLKGEVQTKLVVGTGSSRREYGYQEINEALLLSEIGKLQAEIEALLPPDNNNFRKTFFRTAWSKR